MKLFLYLHLSIVTSAIADLTSLSANPEKLGQARQSKRDRSKATIRKLEAELDSRLEIVADLQSANKPTAIIKPHSMRVASLRSQIADIHSEIHRDRDAQIKKLETDLSRRLAIVADLQKTGGSATKINQQSTQIASLRSQLVNLHQPRNADEDVLAIASLLNYSWACYYTLRHLLGVKSPAMIVRSRRPLVQYMNCTSGFNPRVDLLPDYTPVERVERIKRRQFAHYDAYQPLSGASLERDYAYAVPTAQRLVPDSGIVSSRDDAIANRQIVPATGKGKPVIKTRLGRSPASAGGKADEPEKYKAPIRALDPAIAKILEQVYRR